MRDDAKSEWRVLAGGATAGAVGAISLSAVMIAMHGWDRRWEALKIPAYPLLGKNVMRPVFDAKAVVLGIVCHLAVAVTWGVLFALLVQRLSRPVIVALGAGWGFVVWLVMFALVLPVFAPPLAEGGGSLGNLLIHVVFGLVLGLVFLPFQPHEAGAHGRWRPRSVTAGHQAA